MMLDADNRNRLTTFLMLAIENEHKRANVLAIQYANEEMRADLLQRERALVEQSAAHVARTSEAQKALDTARVRAASARPNHTYETTIAPLKAWPETWKDDD